MYLSVWVDLQYTEVSSLPLSSFLCDHDIKEGELVIFLLFNCKMDLRVLLVKVWEMTVVCQDHGPRC